MDPEGVTLARVSGSRPTIWFSPPVPATPIRLNVTGYDHVDALGDITDLTDPKMATYAQQHAQVVAKNISARLAGERPEAVYTPAQDLRILLPLGTRAGVGQLPTPDGVAAVTTETVSQRKGTDLFTERFAQRFNRA